MNHCIPWFNSERQDPVSGVTHLGNGYRAFHPVLMRFTCLDGWSPFGPGGMNPYAYCSSDPVNRTDPSGHHSMAGWLGIGAGVALGLLLTPVSGGSSLAVALSVVSVTTAVTSAGLAVAQQFVEASDPGTASALGWAALGTGIVSGLSSAALCRVVPGAKSLVSLLKGRPVMSAGDLSVETTSNSAVVPSGFRAGTINAMSNRYMRTPLGKVSSLMNLAVDAVADSPALRKAGGQLLPMELINRVEKAAGDWLLRVQTADFGYIYNVPREATLFRKVFQASLIANGRSHFYNRSEIWGTDAGRRFLLPLLERNSEGYFQTQFVRDMASELGLTTPRRVFSDASTPERGEFLFRYYLYNEVLPREWASIIFNEGLPELPW